MKLPNTGDLIYIKRTISGVITSGDPNQINSSWSTSLTTIEPNQTAIVLKAYNPKITDRTSNILADPNPGEEKGLVVMVISLGEHVIETIYSADYMDIISSVN
tara:strand:- start:5603 stop:5911 length:309 start_codon:yes stop_codon:yes gene_type:complete